MKLKFRQRNRNNGQTHYWGLVDGVWVNPLQQDNFTKPEESEQATGEKDTRGKEIYTGDITIWSING